MEACFLCLEINKDVLDCIRANTRQWQELDITKTIEKYFSSLRSIQSTSWICLSCWQEVDGFHKFYLRIEEAHANFGQIKVENIAVPIEESEEDNSAFWFLEPEILINTSQKLVVDKETELAKRRDQEDIPFRRANKQNGAERAQVNMDPLEKSKESMNKKNFCAKVEAEETPIAEVKKEESKVKKEPMDLSNKDSDSVSDNDNDVSDINNLPLDKKSRIEDDKERKFRTKQRANCKENDKFIAKHFKPIFCDLCQVPVENFPAMRKHFTETHNQPGYILCCQKKFFNRTGLVDHLHFHLNPDHCKCTICGKTMSCRMSFNTHMLRAHRTNDVLKQHSCELCNKSFMEANLLRSHKLTHLPEEEKKFPCSDCGKNYGSPNLLNKHRQAVHLKRFVKICYICGKAINSSAQFNIHMNKHKGILPDINCDICGLRLTSESGLKLHKESQHPVGGKQEHHCPICPKVSPTLKALKRHINTMHEKGYDHKCSICEKAFKRSEALREHMATHTGTTLYTCPWCPRTFNSNGNMHAHRKKVHPKEWEETKLQNYSKNIPVGIQL